MAKAKHVITYSTLQQCLENHETISDNVTMRKQPMLALTVAENISTLSGRADQFNEAVEKLREDYYERDENGDPVTYDQVVGYDDGEPVTQKRRKISDRQAFNDDINDLLQQEVEIDLYTLNLTALVKGANDAVKSKDLVGLTFLLKNDIENDIENGAADTDA